MSSYTVSVPVRWSDQDLNKHVNNAVAVTLLEEARLAAVASWVGPVGVPDPARPRVVAHLDLDYVRPVEYGTPLEVTVTVGRVGRSSFDLRYDAAQEGTTRLRARTTTVQLDGETGRSTPLHDDLRSRLDTLSTDQTQEAR